ncbi:hypothetical protein SAMN05192560_0042 [Methylobacillus rhizosphaerae]|uniref:Uncharacterized protein n=1 Tax=Methylobacillus rhizosphaerae TaxID=551994 RepID=A0A238XMF9_9PROT|nr:hypothetical protein [Methylobacillus rhizosphaerae]SNR60117.1 hypothetical protein SAMN05192560_0042 [Methylobacillus rhizosphaerae]
MSAVPAEMPAPEVTRRKKPDPVRPDWTSKTLAGLLLGLALSLAVVSRESRMTCLRAILRICCRLHNW